MMNKHTIAFYNLENLFDVKDDPYTLDDDFLPWGKKFWTKKRYRKKISKLANTIKSIGDENSGNPPILVGVAEVENAKVLEDLIESQPLQACKYNYVHYDSPDERGIDVALLVNEEVFKIEETNAIPINIVEENGIKDYTRDALYVNGYIGNEKVHVLVMHWPSRRDGVELTSHKRIQAAQQINLFIKNNIDIGLKDKIVLMGDFNDNPTDESLKKYLVTEEFFNPFLSIVRPNKGSLNYRGEWFLFDQIIISHNFFRPNNNMLKFDKAGIFNDLSLKEWKGKHKGKPFRTFKGKKYMGGVSDHFPVYICITST
ncbi:endonuclease/exonuclease/phosphatase family protein [Pseudofulvibacter geojedonensis]|uniref:Endonuclease n=1 Tax=Pseudofulvibacter geojedonensis TaxID=1123758 RepID=A0ABW3I4J7_9FLAO